MRCSLSIKTFERIIYFVVCSRGQEDQCPRDEMFLPTEPQINFTLNDYYLTDSLGCSVRIDVLLYELLFASTQLNIQSD